jgi:hypothetical protein
LLLAFYNGVEVLWEWLGLSKASALWSMTLAFASDLSQSALVERVPRRLLHDDVGAAARQAETACRALGIPGKTACLLANRTALIVASRAADSTRAGETVFGNFGLAEAELTPLAGVEAVPRGRAWTAQLRIADVIERAGPFVSVE